MEGRQRRYRNRKLTRNRQRTEDEVRPDKEPLVALEGTTGKVSSGAPILISLAGRRLSHLGRTSLLGGSIGSLVGNARSPTRKCKD